jgi:hypothetical protein
LLKFIRVRTMFTSIQDPNSARKVTSVICSTALIWKGPFYDESCRAGDINYSRRYIFDDENSPESRPHEVNK